MRRTDRRRVSQGFVALLALSLAVASVACATFHAQADWDPKTDFSRLHSYDWAPRARSLSAAPRDPRIDNDLVDGRVRRAVDATLIEKGFVLAPPGGAPDFRVSYYIGIESKFDVQTIPRAYGYELGYWGGPGYADVYVDQYEQGTLFLDVVDAANDTLVWRGHVSARVLPDLSPEERERRLNDAVHAILARFPPPAGR